MSMRPNTAAPRLALLGFLWALALLPAHARAGIETSSPTATIAFDLNTMPPSIRDGTFSMLLWVWRDPAATSRTSICSVPGLWSLTLDAQGRAELTSFSPSNNPEIMPTLDNGSGAGDGFAVGIVPWGSEPPRPTTTTASPINGSNRTLGSSTIVRTPVPVPAGQWSLIRIVIDRSARTLSVAHQAADLPISKAAASDPALRYPASTTTRFVIGADTAVPAPVPAMPGQLGLMVIRSDQPTDADLLAIVQSRRYLAPMDRNSALAGGGMFGETALLWATNHGTATNPQSLDYSLPRSGYSGAPVGRGNVFTRDGTSPSESYIIARTVPAASGYVYRSHHESRYAGFFIKDIPGTGIGPAVVPGPSTVAHELISGPTTLRRVIISANSRAVKYSDGSGVSPGNFPHGFIANYRSQVAGILMRPPQIYRTGDPWFGFDLKDQEPTQAYDKVTNTALTTGNFGDFARFFTGSAFLGRGPGWGVFIEPTGFYGLRCKPEPGSLMIAAAPLTVEAYAMKFPGASPLSWRPERGVGQLGAPIASPSTAIPAMDTTRASFTLTPADTASTTQIKIPGDQRTSIFPDDACTVASGPGSGCITLVASVTFDGSRSTVTFQKPLLQSPAAGSQLRFGPWSFITVQTTFPAVAPNDPANWRGIRFDTGTGGMGSMILAYSAWRPDTPGFAFGGVGWGGNGYTMQLNKSFRQANIELMKLTKADVWIQVPAQQGSEPSSMDDYLALIRQALPGKDVIWAGESGLTASLQTTWHQYILDNAASRGVVGLSLLEHPDVGSLREQYADMMLGDADHYCQRGNETIARVWMQLLSQSLRPACPADLDRSGTVDFLDLLAFFNFFDAQDPGADLDSSGTVDFSDFLNFLNHFDAGC
jgi:hypothetical protein